MDYIDDIPEDFNPDDSIGYNEHENHDWDFEAREEQDFSLSYKSQFTLNLEKKHPK